METKTLVLTGASRGIGHATVKRFSAAGWRVITLSRQAFTDDCPWSAGAENHLQLDLGSTDAIEQGLKDLSKLLPEGKIHALVNNAGISPKKNGGGRIGVLDSDYQTWLSVLNVNVFGAALMARGLFHQLKAGGGTIINVTSIAGGRVHPFAGSAYAASKAALLGLTREMAHEFGPHGIRVNAISPGEIDTAILSAGTDDIIKNSVPLQRLGTPEEVAAVILFLCSSNAMYVNGAEIHINGGQHV